MKMIYGVVGYLCAVAVLIFFLFRGCERTPQDVLTVGLVHGHPLGTSGDAHNGFDWDIAFFIGQKLHKQLKRKVFYMSEIADALRKNEIDIVCGHMKMTDERMKKMAMVHVYGGPYPYLKFLFWDMSHQKELEAVKHIRDVLDFFEKHEIGVLGRGSIWEGLLKSYGLKHVKGFEDEMQLVRALKQGDVTALIVGCVSTDFLLNQYSNLWALKVEIDTPYSYGIGVALSKERRDLVKQVEEAIQILKDDGTINMLQQKWFGKRY